MRHLNLPPMPPRHPRKDSEEARQLRDAAPPGLEKRSSYADRSPSFNITLLPRGGVGGTTTTDVDSGYHEDEARRDSMDADPPAYGAGGRGHARRDEEKELLASWPRHSSVPMGGEASPHSDHEMHKREDNPSSSSASSSSSSSSPFPTSSSGLRLKLVCLFLLCFHTSGQTMIMRRSRQPDADSSGEYSAAVNVWMGELLKFALSLAAAVWHERRLASSRTTLPLSPGVRSLSLEVGSLRGAWRKVCEDVGAPDAWLMAVPAAMYVVQNLLQIFAISSLPSIVYQALCQLKILAAALVSYPLLGKRLDARQWLMLCVLVVGVVTLNNPERKAIVTHAHVAARSSSTSSSSLATRDLGTRLDTISLAPAPPGNSASRMPWNAEAFRTRLGVTTMPSSTQTMGAAAVLASCLIGSLAGVYMEAKVKRESRGVSLWVRNAQLSAFSLVGASGAVLLEALRRGEWRPLDQFGAWAWAVVVVRAVGGLIVALVVRYADNILKGFATSFAIVVTLLARCAIYGAVPTTDFFVGISLVIASTVGYSYFGKRRA